MSGINPELLLVAKIVETGDLKTALDAGIESTHFVDETCGDYYGFLVDYYTDPEHPRSVPTLELFREQFPRDPLPEPKSRTTVEEFVTAAMNKQLQVACVQLADDLQFAAEQGNPGNTLQTVVSEATNLVGRSKRTRDIMISSHAETVIADYEGAKVGKMRGIPWPWPKMNDLTRGIEDGNLVLYYGRPKQMKSWVAINQAVHFYQTNTRGGKVLLITLEMPPELVARRIAALITRVDYEKFMQGKLNKDEETAMKEELTSLKLQETSDIREGRKREFIIAAPEQDMSVLEIESKIDMYDPDLVVIDGTYLLSDARTKKSGVDWKVLANVSRDLKALAQRRMVPIVGVHQANRKDDEASDDLSDVAFTDSYARDADVLIKCIKVPSSNMGSMIALLFSGAREFSMAGFYIHGKPARSFEYISDFNTKEELLSYIKKGRKSANQTANTPHSTPNVAAADEGYQKQRYRDALK